MAPNRRQAIAWINADLVHWRAYAAIGRDELISKIHPRADCCFGCHCGMLYVCDTVACDTADGRLKLYGNVDQYMWHCFLVLILMHWQERSDIKSIGNQLTSYAKCRVRTHGLWNRMYSKLNAPWKTDRAIDQAKHFKLNSASLWSATTQLTRPPLLIFL